MDEVKHVIPASVQSPAGSGGLAGQGSLLCNFDRADIHILDNRKTDAVCLERQRLLFQPVLSIHSVYHQITKL